VPPYAPRALVPPMPGINEVPYLTNFVDDRRRFSAAPSLYCRRQLYRPRWMSPRAKRPPCCYFHLRARLEMMGIVLRTYPSPRESGGPGQATEPRSLNSRLRAGLSGENEGSSGGRFAAVQLAKSPLPGLVPRLSGSEKPGVRPVIAPRTAMGI